jgi:hypothetical protein
MENFFATPTFRDAFSTMENFFAKPTFGSNAPRPRKTRLSERVWEKTGQVGKDRENSWEKFF